MYDQIILTEQYFDGNRLFSEGPYSLLLSNKTVNEILPKDVTSDKNFRSTREVKMDRVKFLMPALTEAHSHIFLSGEELEFTKRSEYLKSSKEDMLLVAQKNLSQCRDHGVTAVNDAGDIYGINLAIRESVASSPFEGKFLTAGRAIRKKKKYGSFMAVETETESEIVSAVEECCNSGDFLKVLLTGIIDFENGVVKGPPQFDLEELTLIVSKARSLGKRTAVHCSGLDGISIACEAGVDSIEHGFFMNVELLKVMADKQIAWVPTFSPVEFQRERPELAGWNEATVGKLSEILENHHTCLAEAYRLGVPVLVGSDGGSFGVPHGLGAINDLVYMRKNVSDVTALLNSATTLSRKRLGLPSNEIVVGNSIDAISLDGSPYQSFSHLLGEKYLFE